MKRLLCLIAVALITVGAAGQSKTTTAKQSSSTDKSSAAATTAKSSSSSGKSTGTAGKSTTAKSTATTSKTATKTDTSKSKEDKKDDKDQKSVYADKFRFGVTGGLGFNTYTSYTHHTHLALAFKGGVNARMPLLLPDLYVMGEGRLALRTCGNAFTGRMSHAYLEVPVQVGYTIHLNENLGLYAEAGPYLGLRLFPYGYEVIHRDHHHRFIDLGLGLNAGIELAKQFRLSLGFDYGLISPCSWDHVHNGSIWITGTYLL
ncbi:MAG: PorT family protein [Bacteroidales bacterium]|nr:PorT family protein [Bacteroidales bacterium]